MIAAKRANLTIRPAALLLTLLVGTDPCADGQLFRWVDAQGQVHFSDRLPSNPEVSVQVQPLPASPQMPQPVDQTYSVTNQVRQLEAERKQREAARREETRQRLEELRQLAEIEAARAQARQADAEAERARQPRYPIIYPRFWKPPHPGADRRTGRPDRPPRGIDRRPERFHPDLPDARSLALPGRSLTVPGRSLHPPLPPRH